MLAGRRILAVVPARGGSKGVPLKNIRPLNGRPLIAHVASVAAAASWLDRTVVSTDDERIAEVARASGLEVPFMRPAELAADTVGDLPVLRHALLETERQEARPYDIVVMLQPTCPLRTADHVRRVVSAVIDGRCDAAWTVSQADLKFHPLKQLRLDGIGLSYYDERGADVTARQQLEPLYLSQRRGVRADAPVPDRAGAAAGIPHRGRSDRRAARQYRHPRRLRARRDDDACRHGPALRS